MTIPKIDEALFEGRSVLVTGGTGSFGQKFIERVIQNYGPRRLIIYSRDELKQSDMQARFSPADYPALRYFIGDIRDLDRLKMALRGVDTVIHAAALKQVLAAEYNPTEVIHTNVLGAENLVKACIDTGVKRLIALSTDKAVNPINLYGASKLAADKIFIAGNNLSGSDGARFSCVRYGNVVGSRGSVIPLFRRLIAEGAKSLPITDERMTRFWITLDQAVDFVLSSIEMMRGGEVFVPKIPSMRITDLARALAPDLPHDIVGIRLGEKLHEVMITEDDSRITAELDDRYVIEPMFSFFRGKKNGLTAKEKPVEPGFRYSSDTNDQWLNSAELKAMIEAPAH